MQDLDYTSHPAELVVAGKLTPRIGIPELRKAIPEHCHRSSYWIASWYLFRDLAASSLLMFVAFTYIPKIEMAILRWSAWALYGYVEGLLFTGLWVLGHECGHGAFTPSTRINDVVGFMLHTYLLTPYFAWKSTHRRHHIYANNLTMDHNYVPPQRHEYETSLLFNFDSLEEILEDSPIFILIRILLQQALGFPFYLLTNVTAASGSHVRAPSKKPFDSSHFSPTGSLFRDSEAPLILLSDLGLATASFGLWLGGRQVGIGMLALLYLQPYIWLNHWLVAITYLHHTHPDLPKFEAEAWTFLKGATATVDRDFGWIGRHIFHGIIEYHVVHHLFSRIPFYHAEEATKAIIPLLGDSYHTDKRAYLPSLWESFTKCKWVEPDHPEAERKDRIMWYKHGRISSLKEA